MRTGEIGKLHMRNCRRTCIISGDAEMPYEQMASRFLVEGRKQGGSDKLRTLDPVPHRFGHMLQTNFR